MTGKKSTAREKNPDRIHRTMDRIAGHKDRRRAAILRHEHPPFAHRAENRTLRQVRQRHDGPGDLARPLPVAQAFPFIRLQPDVAEGADAFAAVGDHDSARVLGPEFRQPQGHAAR